MLFDSKSEVNVIHPTFAKELGLSIRQANVRVQKINGIILDIYKMVIAVFLMSDKANQVKFFEKTFLMTNISLK